MANQGSLNPPPHMIRIIRIAASVMASMLLAIAILAVWRRHIGAFQIPLPIATYLFIGITIMIPAAALRSWWRFIARTQKTLPIETFWTLCTPTLSIFIVFAAISVPETSFVGILVLAVLFLVCEMLVYWPRRRAVDANRSSVESLARSEKLDRNDHVESTSELSDPEIEAIHSIDAEILSEIESHPEEGVSQQLVRCQTEDGRDCLKGWIRVDIPAGRRAQSFHLAFCPSFHQTPEIEIHPEEKNSAKRIKTVQCLPYGAHLEVKLSRPSPTDETLTLRFQALGKKRKEQ